MKRLLIITYYWPPSGGGGVMRWLKFVRYFRDFGWEPIVYTPENPEMPAEDTSLASQVPEGITILKQAVWEPYSLYKKFTGQKKDRKINTGFLAENETPKLTEELSVWIRGNLFIPDARKYWIKPSAKYLKNYLKENPVDAIVSTGPPHSMHLIALEIKKSLGLPWLADFRDPWTNIDFYPKLKLTQRADKKHRRLEKEVLRKADEVVTVSWSWAKDFQMIVDRDIKVITNGYDPADFLPANEDITLDKKFTLLHIGAMNADRNPENLWKILGDMVKNVPGFKDELEIRLIGSNDFSVVSALDKNGLTANTKLISYLPHGKVLQQTRTAQLLLLPLNDTPNVSGIIPGKLYEYLAARRPILCLGPKDGDSAKIITQSESGSVVDFQDENSLREILQSFYTQYKDKGGLASPTGNIEVYSRKELTGNIAAILDSLS